MVYIPQKSKMDAADLLRAHEDRLSMRRVHETNWREAEQLSRGKVTGLDYIGTWQDPRLDVTFDSIGQVAAEDLASAMVAGIVNPAERFMRLTLVDRKLAEKREVALWLDAVTDLVFSTYAVPAVNYYSSSHENFHDGITYAAGVMYQGENRKRRLPYFQSRPATECCWSENAQGEVDCLDVEHEWDKRRVEQELSRAGDKIPEKILKDKNPNRMWRFVEMTMPRTEYDPRKSTGMNMPIASVIVCKDTKEIVREEGFHEFPYHVWRWEKLSRSPYGTGPAIKMLPTLKAFQHMVKEYMASSELANRPPVAVRDESILDGLGLASGDIIHVEQGMDFPQPITLGAQPQSALQAMQWFADRIMQGFYTDATKLQQKAERQFTTEILLLDQQRFEKMTPIVGRVSKELLGASLRRTIKMLMRWKKIPPPPVDLSEQEFDIVYINRAAMAQQARKGMEMDAFLQQDVIPLAQVDPRAIKRINTERWLNEKAKFRNMSPVIFNTDEELEQIEQEEAAASQMNQLQQGAETGAKIAQATKHLSDAGLVGQQ